MSKMFKFGFLLDENNEKDLSENKPPEDVTWKCAKEIKVPDELNANVHFNELKIADFNIKYTDVEYIANELLLSDENGILQQAESKHSDLITAKYEGGLKIWECTKDTLDFISLEQNIDFTNKKILDLGCGAGLIGILALLKGGIVSFQDYNEEVINLMTIPNVLSNLSNREQVKNNCKFYSGDWGSFLNITESKISSETCKFDYIFTSETIYNTNNYSKLYSIFKHRLKKSGKVYLAAKTYYFGVGGGTRQFENYLKKENIFITNIVWKCSTGVNREIMEIKLR